MIAWDRRIVMHHHPNTTTPDGEIQDNAGPSNHSAPIVDTIRKFEGELQTKTQSSWSLNLEDKVDLKRAEITPSLESARVLTTDPLFPYRFVPLVPDDIAKIDYQLSISTIDDRLREKLTVDSQL
ncbi:hypothetical protein B296_00030777, partial [Ensete ventricosum]